jgi:hypothetical protein
MLKLQPPRESRIDGRRRLCNAGMVLDKGFYAGKLTQALS